MKFLVGKNEEFEDLLIINAKNKGDALNKYIDNIDPDETFLEHLHDRSINMGFAEIFHYDNESDGQEYLPEIEVLRRITEYFKLKPEYEQIYLSKLDEAVAEEKLFMAKFPDEMIKWIWKKELKSKRWTDIRLINLGIIKEIQ